MSGADQTYPTDGASDDEAAARVLEKVRGFVSSLDRDERAVFAALLAPGVASAYSPDTEVAGFAMDDWSPDRLPDALRSQVREQHIRVEFD